MNERETDRRGSQRRRVAGHRPRVARLVLQPHGRQGLGPGKLVSGRPVAADLSGYWRSGFSSSDVPLSCSCSVRVLRARCRDSGEPGTIS